MTLLLLPDLVTVLLARGATALVVVVFESGFFMLADLLNSLVLTPDEDESSLAGVDLLVLRDMVLVTGLGRDDDAAPDLVKNVIILYSDTTVFIVR